MTGPSLPRCSATCCRMRRPTRRRVVWYRSVRSGAAPEIAVEVSDTGRGIAPDIAPRIFDLFVQGPRTIDRREGGLGLGLAIARSLVEQHDGRIEAHSDGPGAGSTFTVYLPRASAAASCHPSGAQKRRRRAHPRVTHPHRRRQPGRGGDAVDAPDRKRSRGGDRERRSRRRSRPSCHLSPDVAVLDIGCR